MIRLVSVLSFLPALAHELTHYAVARVHTSNARIRVEITGAKAVAQWPPLESAVWRFLAFLAPSLFGSLLITVWLLSNATIDGWRLIMAVGLAFYTVPSPRDVTGALGKQEVQTAV